MDDSCWAAKSFHNPEVAITQEMIDLSPAASDVIREENPGADPIVLSGYANFYIPFDGNLQLIRKYFRRELSKPLTPFSYKKPYTEQGGPLNPKEKEETEKREGYYPLATIKGAYRGPNHWHRCDDILICAVQKDGKWKIRCFPKENIEEKSWSEAQEMLSEASREA
jgi:hypothetical protein